jgi:hypothetical protein
MTSRDWRPTAFVETTPGRVSDDEADAARVARRATSAALLRLLLALDALALLVVAAVTRDPASAFQRHACGVAVAAFLVGVVAAGVGSLGLLGHAPRAGAARPRGGRVVEAAAVLACLALLVGMAAVAVPVLVATLR